MILIVTGPADGHADAMEEELRRRGACWARFDPAEIPTRAAVAVRSEGRRLRRTIRRAGAGADVDLDAVRAVWFRRPDPPVPPAHLDGWVGEFVADESAAVVGDLFETLEVLAVPAPRPTVKRAQYKLRQLQLAARLGFEIPVTVAGNDPDAVLELFTESGGALVTKMVGGRPLSAAPDGGVVVRYTEPLRRRDVVHIDGVRSCPVMVQAYVPKRLEFRVTVVGEQVFAAAIHSQGSHHTKHDWRRYDQERTTTEPYSLPPEVAARCVALTRTLGLCYGALDLVLTPDGRFVFLEINPSGQYLWIEQLTGMPITSAIADLLCAADTAAPDLAPMGAFDA